MTLHEKLKSDLKVSMKEGDAVKTEALRVVIGEFPRLNKKAGELPTDEDVLKILKSLQKNEMVMLESQGYETSSYLQIIESYLPKMMTKEEIVEFIGASNIDMSKFKNKMQAMGPIMKELKGKADGNLVKEVLSALP